MITVINHKNRYEEGKTYEFKFRKFYAKGISPSQSDILETFEGLERDSFIKINGKEIY